MTDEIFSNSEVKYVVLTDHMLSTPVFSGVLLLNLKSMLCLCAIVCRVVFYFLSHGDISFFFSTIEFTFIGVCVFFSIFMSIWWFKSFYIVNVFIYCTGSTLLDMFWRSFRDHIHVQHQRIVNGTVLIQMLINKTSK